MTPSPSEQPPSGDVRYETSGAGLARIVVALTILVSLAMGVGFYLRYSRTLLYVKATLEDPAVVHPWDTADLAPTACVDAAMDWAAGCSGIKAMCDMYVDQVIALCMGSDDRTDYCAAIADASPARFGAEDCRLRGVQRYVDSEACAKAYGAIVAYCNDVRARAGQGEPAGPAPESARREAGTPL